MGLVAVPVIIPAFAAANKCTQVASFPLLRFLAMICFPLPYAKKFIERAGTTPTRVGPSPLKRARGDSSRYISLNFVSIRIFAVRSKSD